MAKETISDASLTEVRCRVQQAYLNHVEDTLDVSKETSDRLCIPEMCIPTTWCASVVSPTIPPESPSSDNASY